MEYLEYNITFFCDFAINLQNTLKTKITTAQ